MNVQLFEAQRMLEAFRKGEEKGLSHYMRWLYPGLMYYSFQIMGDKVICEDIVAEAFEKIWPRRLGFFEAAKIKSWLYATVRNACYDQFRKRTKEQTGLDGMEIIMDGDMEKPHLELMIETEAVSAIYNHLNNLPDRCQSVMRLLFVEGKSLTEVAIQMKVSINTVKNQRARGLEIIRKRFAPTI